MAFNLLNTFGASLETRNADTRGFLQTFTTGLQIKNQVGKVEEQLKADLQKIYDQTGVNISDEVIANAHLQAESAAGNLANIKDHYKHLGVIAKARFDAAQAEMDHQLAGIKMAVALEEQAHARAQAMITLGNQYHRTQIKTMGQALPSGGRNVQRYHQMMAGTVM